MVNEEDHLRLQVLHSGYSVRQCWEIVNRLDDLIEEKVTFAYSEEFGYLTACPTNVGTGMRASVMLHLPALSMTKQIDRVFRALQKIQLAVRGLYGEGSQASGDFYQISNNITLGKTEDAIISNIEVVVPTIVNYDEPLAEASSKRTSKLFMTASAGLRHLASPPKPSAPRRRCSSSPASAWEST